jgi:hypothetical protein
VENKVYGASKDQWSYLALMMVRLLFCTIDFSRFNCRISYAWSVVQIST